ncbi:MAG: FAD-dependent oxidoreductase, partial [bacterium]
FLGKGVSYCATCDGFLFKGKKVAVVGGGNSAVIDAIYLSNIGCKVILIHRRKQLRADQVLQRTLFDRDIKVIWNSTIEEIQGDKIVCGVKIKDKANNKIRELKVDGVFVSIGEEPNNQLAKSIKVKLDEHGYIITDKSQRTNIPKVYGAGDITGGLKQIITASAEGAIAATSAYEDIKNPYWADRTK